LPAPVVLESGPAPVGRSVERALTRRPAPAPPAGSSYCSASAAACTATARGKPTWRNDARLAASDERPPTIVFGGRADRRRAPSPDATGDGRCLIPSCRSCPALAASHAPGGALSLCATSGVAADVVRAAAQR